MVIGKQKLNHNYIFFIQSLCFQPCVLEFKNRFIKKKKSLLTFHHKIRSKYWFDLSKCLTKLNPILKLCIVFSKKLYLSDSGCVLRICYVFNSEQLSLVESAVGTLLACRLQPWVYEGGKASIPLKLLHF